MTDVTETKRYIVFFADDTETPVPVRAPGRSEAFKLGRKVTGERAAAAITADGGADFSDVDEDFYDYEDY